MAPGKGVHAGASSAVAAVCTIIIRSSHHDHQSITTPSLGHHTITSSHHQNIVTCSAHHHTI
eukprot:2828880-Rhodomonas_salina.1